MTEIRLQCIDCKYLLPGRKCKAFPTEIPDEIFVTGEFDHTNPHPKDNGIQFEKDEQPAL